MEEINKDDYVIIDKKVANVIWHHYTHINLLMKIKNI